MYKMYEINLPEMEDIKPDVRHLFPKELTTRSMSLKNIITLNVGGIEYRTSIDTIQRYPKSILGRMTHAYCTSTDGNDVTFIDANGDMFKHILNFLRRNKLLLPDGFKDYELLLTEAEFFQIKPMVDLLRKRMSISSNIF